MKSKFYLFSTLIFILSFSFIISSCGKKDETETSTTETKDGDGITYYYNVTGEQLTGSMKVSRKGDDKFFWERKLASEGVEMVMTVISDNKDVYVISDFNGEKKGYKSTMDNYNSSIDKAGQVCIINPGRNIGNFEKVGTTKILNEDCTIYQVPDGTKFIVSDNGKTVYGITLDEMFDVKFTNNQTVPPPSDELFAIPADVEFEVTDDIISKF